jgi:uncharacterized membrane protein YedE/YeeE
MNILTAFVAGLIFGAGLLVAGMANPAKVLAFLDIAGSWDPSLAFVMIGAIGIGTPAFFIAKRKSVSLLGEKMQLPTSQVIDARLIGGSVLFGIGWGIAGICPGPALVLLGAGVTKGIIFVLAMIAGMLIFQALEKLKAAA